MVDTTKTYMVDDQPVTMMITMLYDVLYATTMHQDKKFLERVWKYFAAEGWMLDNIEWTGYTWYMALFYESSDIIN